MLIEEDFKSVFEIFINPEDKSILVLLDSKST